MNEHPAGASSPDPAPDQPTAQPAAAPEPELPATPPLLTAEPPVLPPVTPPPPAEPRRPSVLLWTIVIILGVLQAGLAFATADLSKAPNPGTGYRIGYVMGGTVLFPLVILGLFSIGARFRTTRNRLIILSVVWGYFLLGHLGNLGKLIRVATTVVSRPGDAQLEAQSLVTPEVKEFLDFKPSADGPSSVTAAPHPAAPATYDLSRGSDQRLIKLIESAQQDSYRAVVAAYAQACRERPRDAVVALERVKFIERFVYTEDMEIEGASEDHDAAVEYLTSRFPDAPGTVLYQLNQTYGPERTAALRKHETAVRGWPKAERAEFALMQAQAAEASGDTAGTLTRASESFSLNPTVEAGLLLAEKSVEAGQRDQARQALANPVFADALPWNKKQQLTLLLKCEAGAEAMALLATLEATSPQMVQDPDIAEGLARLGHVAKARALLEAIALHDWNRQEIGLRRFQFELKYGDEAQALAAYRQFRDSGVMADPFLRQRMALFGRFPGAGWALQDLAGAMMLGLMIGLCVVLPLILLVPVHYWGLLRERKGKPGGWPEPRWGLRHAWMLLGTIVGLGVALVWLVRPEALQAWLGGKDEPPALPGMMFWMQMPVWGVLGAILAWLLWRGRAWSLLGPGQWTAGRALGVAFVALLGLRFALGLYVVIWPEVLQGGFSAATSDLERLAHDIRDRLGAVGLLAVFAVLVPLVEELIFRGVLLQAVGKYIPFAWANALQAALFAAVHESFALFPFFFLFGFVCGELTRRCGGLLPALLIHVGNNALVCALFLAGRGTGV